jgi:hypothetical protein
MAKKSDEAWVYGLLVMFWAIILGIGVRFFRIYDIERKDAFTG